MTDTPARGAGASGASALDSALRWKLAPDLDEVVWKTRLARSVELIEGGRVRNEKTGRRKELYRLHLGTPHDGGEPDHLVKVNRYSWRDGWRRRWAGSKARRELERACQVASLGIATPVPLAAAERHGHGRLLACYLIVPIVEGARDLRQIWNEGLPRDARSALAERFGAFVRAAHEAGIDQDDLAPNNFLLTPSGDLRMIDFERARLGALVSPGARDRALAKLHRELARASLADRARFLSGYAGGDRKAWRTLWRRLEQESLALAARDARRLVRVTSRPGRRFRTVEHAGWRGSRRAEFEPAELGKALDSILRAPPSPARGAVSYRNTGDWWAVDHAIAGREARRTLAIAELLWRRGGLGPRPLAQLSRGPRTLTIFSGGLPARSSSLPNPAARLPSLTVQLDRLLALGRLEGLEIEDFGFGPAKDEAAVQLLAACRLHADGTSAAGRHERARAEARRLLGLAS
ncbi:MAG: lipopolysaccharide kinase InaA family protein [Myxococcota bacterium]